MFDFRPTFVTLRPWKRTVSASDSVPTPRRSKSDFLPVKAIFFQSVASIGPTRPCGSSSAKRPAPGFEKAFPFLGAALRSDGRLGPEHFARFLGRRYPVNFSPLSVPAFWMSTLLWLFPWFLFLPVALPRRGERWSRRLAPAWIWTAVIMVFFTLTGSRMEYYALPAFPALAVILGFAWRRFMIRGRSAAAMLVPSLIVAAVGLIAAPLVFFSAKNGMAVLASVVSSLDGYYREYFGAHPGAAMVLGNELLRLARPFPIVLLLLGITTFLALRKGRPRLAFALWVVGAVPILGLADGGMSVVTRDRSQRAAATIVGWHWTPGARLVVAGDYEEACGITFYLGKPTQVVGGPGSDMLFGYRRGDAPEVFLSPDAFRRICPPIPCSCWAAAT